MHLEMLLPAIALIALTRPSDVAADLWDSIPIVSQLKSMVQVVSGDEEGARQTQENFFNEAPLVSQVKSLVDTVAGDNEKAGRTQLQLFPELIERMVDNTPLVGHIKGAIHKAVIDEELGERILKGATDSTTSIVDRIFGGPAGTIAAGAASDGIITGMDSAVHKKYKPFGFVKYASKIDKLPPGEHFDTWLGIVSDVMARRGRNQRRDEAVAFLPTQKSRAIEWEILEKCPYL